MDKESLILEIEGQEIPMILRALGEAHFNSHDSPIAIALCVRLSEALNNPAKNHAYNKPRRQTWMRKSI